jgi:hypothetical protein
LSLSVQKLNLVKIFNKSKKILPTTQSKDDQPTKPLIKKQATVSGRLMLAIQKFGFK